MICKNCEAVFEGNFCYKCGQSSKVRKINIRYFLDEIPNSIFQINRGILFTVKELFIRPGHSIREFVEGKRKNHTKPIAFLLLTSTLYVLLNYFLGQQTFLGEFIEGVKSFDKNNDAEILNIISKNQAYLIFIILPFFSIASYLAFIKSKYNLFEHIILNLYITGQQMLVYMMYSFVIDAGGYGLIALPLLSGAALNIWAYIQFFDKNSKLKNISLIIVTYIIFIMQVIVGMILLAAMLKFIE